MRTLGLLGVGLALFLVGVACYFLPVLNAPDAIFHILWRFLLFAIYLVGVWWSRELRAGGLLYVCIALGLLQYALMVPLAPSMSDDIFRYLWDGHVQLHGINPYLYAPVDPQLSSLYDPLVHPFINHAEYRTIYPPTAQLLFALAAAITPERWWGYKILILVAHGATLLLLAWWLHRRKLPMGRLLWYAWCPLPLCEGVLDGHLDIFAPPFLLAILLATQARRPGWCGIFLGCALLLKPLPLFLVPLLLWHFRWMGAVRLGLSCALTCVLLYLPFLDAGTALFSSLLAYSRHWSFNGPIYSLLSIWFIPGACRLIAAGSIVLIAVATPFVGRRWPLELRCLLPLTAYMAFAPTLYPWYLLWLAPWLVLTPMPWLFWCVGTVASAHFVQHVYTQSGIWMLPKGILWFEFVPVVLLLGMQVGLVWRMRRKVGQSEATT